MSREEGFDFRWDHGFRNPPVPPPSPFPGAWDSAPSRSRSGYYPRDRLTFRRPPGPWRTPITGPAMPPTGHYFEAVCAGSSTVSRRSPYSEQYGGYLEGYGHAAGYGRQSYSPPRGDDASDRASAKYISDSNVDGSGYGQGEIKSERQQYRRKKSLTGETCAIAPSHGAVDEHSLGGIPSAHQARSSYESGGRSSLTTVLDVEGAGSADVAGAAAPPGGDYFVEENVTGGSCARTVVPSARSEAARGSATSDREDIWAQVQSVEGQEEDDGEEDDDVGLVMSPAWAEHLRNSPKLQQYLRRTQGNNVKKGGGRGSSKGGRARDRGTKSKSDRGTPSGSAGAKKKGATKGKAKSQAGADSDSAAPAEESEESKKRAVELEQAKLRAQALLYAQGNFQQLEGIAEEEE